jgi:hypothetical protein
MKHTLAVLALAMLSAAPVSAATFGSIGAGNDGLAPLDLGSTLNGLFGEQVNLNIPTAIKITILGYEAGLQNSFSFGGTTWQSPGGSNFFDTGAGPDYLGTGLFSWVVNNVTPGILDFAFGIGSTNADLVNGSNPDVTTGPYAANFFTSYLPDQNDFGGYGALLFLDEGGDSDYDDLIVRLEVTTPSTVPLPAGGLLLAGAMAGLAGLRRRRGTAA